MKNRSDGRRIRNVDPMQLITCFLMKKRYDSMNLYEDTILCEVWDNYIKEKQIPVVEKNEVVVQKHITE